MQNLSEAQYMKLANMEPSFVHLTVRVYRCRSSLCAGLVFYASDFYIRYFRAWKTWMERQEGGGGKKRMYSLVCFFHENLHRNRPNPSVHAMSTG